MWTKSEKKFEVGETSTSDRGSECKSRMIFTVRPRAGHVHLAACFQCRFARRTRKPNPVPAVLPAVIERRPHIQDGDHVFFLLFWCFQWQIISQYACKHRLSKQERPEPRPGGYDLKIYGPRGGAVPRLTSLIIDEAHQRVQCHGCNSLRCDFAARATIRPSWILAPRFQWNPLRIRIRNHGKCWDPEMEIFRFTRGSEGLLWPFSRSSLERVCPFDSEFGSCPVTPQSDSSDGGYAGQFTMFLSPQTSLFDLI